MRTCQLASRPGLQISFWRDSVLYQLISALLAWTMVMSSLPAYGANQPRAEWVRARDLGATPDRATAPKASSAAPKAPTATTRPLPRSARVSPRLAASPSLASLHAPTLPGAQYSDLFAKMFGGSLFVLSLQQDSSLQVSVGFADNSSASANFPVPWNEPNALINFVGGGTMFRAGAVRLDNPGSLPVTADSVTVDLGRPGPVFQLWQNVVVPAGGSAILTQTVNGNFNSSASPIVGCGLPLAGDETRIPKITVTVSGTSTDYADTAHVLDTGGFDSSCRGNQSLAWRPVGTAGMEAPGGSIQLINDGAPHAVGTQDTVTVQVKDAGNQPLANAPVALSVLNGPNDGRNFTGITDSTGAAVIQYSGTTQGNDLIQAAVNNLSGGSLPSQQATTTWSSADACAPPSNPSAAATRLIYVGQNSISFGDIMRLAILLTDGTGNPLSGRSIAFTFAGHTSSASTDGNGIAMVLATTLPVGQSTVAISFAGDSSYQAAQLSTSVTVLPAPTLLRDTGSNLVTALGQQQVSAVLTNSLGTTPVVGRTVTFTLNGISASAVTDDNGSATATLNFSTALTTGSGQLQINFVGDANYLPSSRTASVQIYQPMPFVVWGGNSGGLRIGQRVNFWGAQWESQVINGQYFAANPSFKGWSESLTGPIQQCQVNVTPATLTNACWDVKPGQSFPPDQTLPSLIEVIISTVVNKSGSDVFGNIACGAVLSVDHTPPYGAVPGQPGFGTIVAVSGDCAGVFPAPAVLVGSQQQTPVVLLNQSVPVNYSIQNNGATDATSVTLSENFDQVTPTSATADIGTIAVSATSSGNFQITIPGVGARQGTESSVDYQSRLAAQDGRIFTSQAEVTYTDIFNQLYSPLDFSSFSRLTLPRLSVGVSGISCIAPGTTIPYQLSVENGGSAAATHIAATLTLPDGSATTPAVPDLASGTRFVGTVNWQSPGIAAKLSAESTQDYLARLQAADGATLPAAIFSSTWQDTFDNAYGPVEQPFIAITQRIPIVSTTVPATQSLLPNQTVPFAFNVSNSGTGNAVTVTLKFKRQDGTFVTIPNFSLPSGQSAAVSANYRAPAVAAKGAAETDAAYISRLQSLDNSTLNLSANLSWTDPAQNNYGSTDNPFTATEKLPVLNVALNTPATANSGDSISYAITLTNPGHATAIVGAISITLPDGSVQHPSPLSNTIAPGASTTASVTYTIPATHPNGTISATAFATWSDAVANEYGPLSAFANTTVRQPNQPPVVSAGPNLTLTLPTNTATLNGSVTDDGLPAGTLNIQWSELSGPATVTFGSPTTPVTLATFPVIGTYVLRLSASDTQLSSFADVSVLVNPAPKNQPPQVNAGPSLTVPLGTTFTLQGTVTDDGLPNGSLTTRWTQVSGPSTLVFTNATQPTTTVLFDGLGTYGLRLTASDGEFTVTSDVTFVVVPPHGQGNQAPIVNAGADQIITLPTAAVLNGSVVDDGLPSGTLQIFWSKASGPGDVTFADSSNPKTTATFSVSGEYVLRLNAGDSQLFSSSDVKIVAGQLDGTRSSKGTEFWLMFPEAFDPGRGFFGSEFPPRPFLFINSETDTNGTVSIPGINFAQNFTVAAHQLITVPLPFPDAFNLGSEIISKTGIHITADHPVTVYGVTYEHQETDAFLALPVSVLGTEYVNASYSNNGLVPGSEFGVVAAYDNTTVTITPSVNTVGRAAGQPYTVVLHQGRTYQLRNTDTDFHSTHIGDLTGTIITSDKPIAVYGAHLCANIPGNISACNHIVEQLTPTNTWGTQFATMPLVFRTKGDPFRIIAATDNTNFSINGVPTATLGRGEFYEVTLTQPSYITSDQPIMLVQYEFGTSFDGIQGDPTMIVIPPLDQFRSSYTISTVNIEANWFQLNYVNVVVPTGAIASLKVDGVPVNATLFRDVPDSGFSGAQIAVTPGVHQLAANSPFGAFVYGLAPADAYGYTAGIALGGAPGASLSLAPAAATRKVGTQACVIANVTDANQGPLGAINVIFAVSGTNSQTTHLETDGNGQAKLCYPSNAEGVDSVSASILTTSASSSINWQVNPANQPPSVSSVTELFVNLSATAKLIGSVVDDGLPANAALAAQWSQVSGPGTATFSSPASAVTSASFTIAGDYLVRLTVSDSDLSGSADVIVHVNDDSANAAPVISTLPVQTLDFTLRPSGIITISPTVSDDGLPLGSKLSFNWILLNGDATKISLLNPTSQVLQVKGTDNGSEQTFTLRLIVDDSRLTSTLDVTVKTVPANRAPVVDPGPALTTALPNATVTLNGRVTDDGKPLGGTLTVHWQLESGPGPAVLSSPDSAVTTASFIAPGTYSLKLTANDGELLGFNSTTVTVNAENTAPKIAFIPNQTITLPTDTVTFTVGITDDGLPAGVPLKITWTQFAGPGPVTISSPGNNVTQVQVPQLPGTYRLQLTVDDSQYQSVANAFIIVNPANQPPVVNAGPNQTGVLPSPTLTLSGTVTDDRLPSGAPLTQQWSVVSGPGPVTFTAPTQPVTLATFTVAGTYLLRLTATDTQFTVSSDVTVTIFDPGQNLPPTVFAGLPQSITLPTKSLTLVATVKDDGKPAGAAVSVAWSEVSGPAPVVFSNPNSSITNVTFSTAGAYVLRITANDTQLSSSSDVAVVVNPQPNGPPFVGGLGNGFFSLKLPNTTITMNGVVSDDGLPNGTLDIQWIQADGPGLAVFSAPHNPVTQITVPPSPGRYTFLLTASDGQYKTNVTVFLDVAANSPPSVGIQASALTIRLPQNTVTLVGQATDDGVPGGPLTYQWEQVTGPAPVALSAPTSSTTQAVFTDPGSYIFHLMVSDGQLTSIRAVQITVLPPLPPAPTVAIISPSDGDEITHRIDVIGSATSDTFWFLEYALVTSDDDNALVWNGLGAENAGLFGPYVNTRLGSFDPSLLLNGTYKIRLRTTDNEGQSASQVITVTVNRNLKVGQLTLSFNDLTIPVAGLPIQVIRSYDSRDRRQGDFGFGWSLGLENVRLQKNRILGKTWNEDVSQEGLFPVYCLKTVDDHTVTITFPDGKVYKFRAVAAPECQQFSPIQFPQIAFQELPSGPGTQGATLQIVNPIDLLLDGAIPGPQNLVDLNTAIYNPTVFKLTTAEGFSYVIDQNFGATSVTDPNGNTLTISNTGIRSSTGASAVFVRDAKNHITQITDARGNLLKYLYDSFGHLISFTDAANNTTTFSYDQNTNLLTGITDARGVQVLKSIYDGGGRLIQTNDATGLGTQYQHDIPGQRETVIDRLGNKTILEYDADGNVTRTTDALGNVTTRTYDENDNKLSETNALGKTTNFAYDGSGNKLAETDPLGHVTSYSYTGRNQLLSITDALGQTTSNSYDGSGSLLSMRDPLGNTTSYSYNGQGLPVTVKDAAGHSTALGYDGSGRITSQTDVLGNVTTFTYDAAGNRLSRSVVRTKADGTTENLTTQYQYDGDNRLVKTINPDGSTTRIVYNTIGKQSDIFDELNRQTHYDYDSNGRRSKTTYPDGTFESSTYDANDRRITSTDRAGRVTSFTYDALGQLTKITSPDLSTTQTVYDAAGQVIKKIDALGHATSYIYDDVGRRISSTDALGHVTTFAYDAAGNQISVTDALNHITRYVYDSLNRRSQTVYPDQTIESVAYDALGRQVSKTDQAGKVTQYGYDALRRLTSVTQFLNALPVTTTYAYDEVGNRIRQTDANGHTTSFVYDQLGRHISRQLPLGMSETYGYDAAGNMISKQDFNGRTTTYQYDSMNRLTTKSADVFFAQNLIGASQVSFTYSGTGKRLSMTDASGVTNYTYDNRDRLLTKATPSGTVTYTYDAASNVLSLKSSNAGGASMTYTYDILNRLSTATDVSGVTTYNYDAAGNLNSYVYPNGVLTSYAYDPLNRLTNMQSTCTTGTDCTSPGALIASYAYTLGPTGNRLSVAELSGRMVQYGYDDLYHLISETVSGATSQNGMVSYKYDAVGNRTKIDSTLPAIPASGLLNYDANDRTASVVFDSNGNTINNGTQNAYDFEDHLVQSGGVNIVYDGDGNRVKETIAGVTTNYLVADENLTGYAQVLDELQGGSVTRAYSYGLGLLNERQIVAGALSTSFYGHDGHGSVRFLSDSAGTVTDTYDYDAFGNLIASAGTTPNLYLFGSEQFDPALGLYYSRARYLDVRNGRFMTMDPEPGNTRDPISLHRYLYTNNNPVNAMDPSGRETLAELGASIDVQESLAAIRVSQRGMLVSEFLPAALKCVYCIINPGYRLQDEALDLLAAGEDSLAQEAYEAGQKMIVKGYSDLASKIGNTFTLKDMVIDWGLERIADRAELRIRKLLNDKTHFQFESEGNTLKQLIIFSKAVLTTYEFGKEMLEEDPKAGLACKALQIAEWSIKITSNIKDFTKGSIDWTFWGGYDLASRLAPVPVM